MELDAGIRYWLLDSDPSLKWRVQRDLCGEPIEVWEPTRQSIATVGFGARMLAEQDSDGQWAGGAYFPAHFDFAEAGAGKGQPYTATTWALNDLRGWGLPAEVLAGTAEKLDSNCRWEYDDLPYWGGDVDACINGFTIANGAWLGADVSGLEKWFVEHQMAEGGWNCEWVDGSTRSSVDSTLNSLKGILVYEAITGGSDALRAARHAGEEYLLQRHLLRKLSTGEEFDGVREFAYPFRWMFTVLNAVDYFRSAALHDGTAPDPRMTEAVEIVRGARGEDGRWVRERRPKGRVWFDEDAPEGDPSKWLTFHALRVLDWWDNSVSL